MRNSNCVIIGFLLALILLPLSAHAQLQTSWDYVSSYIWRGFDANPSHEPVVQPAVGYEFGDSGFYLEWWWSFSFNDRDLNEMDLIASYTYGGIRNVSLTAGLIHYGWYFVDFFDFSLDTSHEVFLSGALPNILFQPSLTMYYDFTNGDGFYLELQSEESVEIYPWLGARLFASLGYNGGQWLAEESDPGFSDFNWGFDIPFKLGKVVLVPYVRWTHVLLEAIGKETHFWYGASLRFSIG